MIDHRVACIIGFFLVSAVVAGAAPLAPDADWRVEVRPERAFQTIEGFGASGGWWASAVGNWPDADRMRLLKLLFSRDGIGLTIYRHNLGAADDRVSGTPDDHIHDPWRRAIDVAPGGKIDLSRDAAALRVLHDVRTLGVKQFVLFANSPPAWLTINGITSGGPDGGENLRAGAEDQFANNLVAIGKAIQAKFDLPSVTLSPINEPQWRWGGKDRSQEGAHYSPERAAALLHATVRAASGTGLKVEGPEAGEWGKATLKYVEAILRDPSLVRGLSHLAIHSYWSNRAQRVALCKVIDHMAPKMSVAMTEWCQMEHGRHAGMDGAMALARTVYDDLTAGHVTSWSFWLAVSRYGYADGLIYVDASPKSSTGRTPTEGTQTFEPAKRLWSLGQWSRFVTPGSECVEVELHALSQAHKDEKAIPLATAFKTPQQTLIVVLINPSDRSQRIAALNIPRYQPADCYTTDATHSLARTAWNGDPIELPASSITTLVLQPIGSAKS